MLKESTVSWFMAFATDALYDDFDFKDEYIVLYELIVRKLDYIHPFERVDSGI